MTWEQIEKKWAAMARRVRADWKGAAQDDASHPTTARQSGLPDMHRGPVLVHDVQPPQTIAAMIE